MENLQTFLDRATMPFEAKLKLLVPEAGRWLQYVNYEYKEELDVIVLTFKTSSYGISFELSIPVYSALYGVPPLFAERQTVYNYFRNLKYAYYDNL